MLLPPGHKRRPGSVHHGRGGVPGRGRARGACRVLRVPARKDAVSGTVRSLIRTVDERSARAQTPLFSPA